MSVRGIVRALKQRISKVKHKSKKWKQKLVTAKVLEKHFQQKKKKFPKIQFNLLPVKREAKSNKWQIKCE